MHGIRVTDDMLTKVEGEIDEVELQMLREHILLASKLYELQALEGHPSSLPSIQAPSTSSVAAAHPEPEYDPGRSVAIF